MKEDNGLGIAPEIKKEKSGANLGSLVEARAARADFISEFGFVPTSILKNNRADRALDFKAKNSYKSKHKTKQFIKDDAEMNKQLQNAFDASKSDLHRLSRFPQNIGRLLVKFYCPEGGLVYDCFAGHNSRMQLVFESGRHYIGVDVCKEFMEHNEEIRTYLLNRHQQSLAPGEPPAIKLILGSSDKVDLPDNYADFTITSPPYYDLEYYGDEPQQLGNAPTYQAFLDLLYNHVKENFRILKPGAYCVWNVNDFRKRGLYYPYHIDLTRLFDRAGFTLHNIYIMDLGNPFTVAFVKMILATMAFPKQHEYLMIFQKPL